MGRSESPRDARREGLLFVEKPVELLQLVSQIVVGGDLREIVHDARLLDPSVMEPFCERTRLGGVHRVYYCIVGNSDT